MTCAHAVRVAVQKLEGVEAVEVSLQRKAADIQLRPGNRLTLTRFRQIILNSGFTPKEALVTVRGLLIERGGKPAVNVTGLDVVWRLVEDPKSPGAYKDVLNRLAGRQATPVNIVGTVVPPSTQNQPDEVRVQSIATDAPPR